MSDAVARRFPASAVVALASAVAGVGVSLYLTIEHYNHSLTLACPENATLNCVKVTTSRWSIIAGVPVAVLGLGYFIVMCTLLLIPSARGVDLVRLAGASAGVLMVLFLVYVELFEVDAICLWCTAVHVLTVVMFAAVLWQRTSTAVG